MSDGSGAEMLSSVADHRVGRQLKERPRRDFEERLDTSICVILAAVSLRSRLKFHFSMTKLVLTYPLCGYSSTNKKL